MLEDLLTIWDWVLIEKLHIPPYERNMYSAILVVPETFDNRGTRIYSFSCLSLLKSGFKESLPHFDFNWLLYAVEL